MSYTTQALIQAAIPPQHLNDALDDDGDGTADAGMLDGVIAKASQTVDALIAAQFATPIADPVPAPVREAAFVFACELIYDRRQILEKNPYRDRADKWRERLADIGAGKSNLDAAVAPGAEYGGPNYVPNRQLP